MNRERKEKGNTEEKKRKGLDKNTHAATTTTTTTLRASTSKDSQHQSMQMPPAPLSSPLPPSVPTSPSLSPPPHRTTPHFPLLIPATSSKQGSSNETHTPSRSWGSVCLYSTLLYSSSSFLTSQEIVKRPQNDINFAYEEMGSVEVIWFHHRYGRDI